jgi:site-specific DNA recombinase
MDCAIYTRVSTDNQADVEFNSCEAQEAKIRSFISSQEGMEVFKVYSDPGYTGANLNRPALSKMLNDIKERRITLVISYKIDRLTRSPKDFYHLVELFEKYNVDFISVTERFDTSTPSGRLLRNIMLTFAQFERELASERTKDKMLQRADKGMWNGGLIPFGYDTIDKKLVFNESNAKTVCTIYNDYIEGRSIAEISKITGLSKSRISTILRNFVYIGKMKYAGKIYQGNHEPVISEEVFNLVQEKHKEKKLILRLYKDYPLAGLLNCKACNSFMTPCHTNKKKKNKIKRYYYYRCTKTFKKDWHSCDVQQVSADRLEDHIFKSIERISVDKHYIDSLIFKLNNSQQGDRIGLEPTQSCPKSLKISAEIFEQTLRLFVKGLSERKGIEKNLWLKKFIKGIKYSKKEIDISFYYKRGFEEVNPAYSASGRVGAAAGRSTELLAGKKITPIHMNRGNTQDWLPG